MHLQPLIFHLIIKLETFHINVFIYMIFTQISFIKHSHLRACLPTVFHLSRKSQPTSSVVVFTSRGWNLFCLPSATSHIPSSRSSCLRGDTQSDTYSSATNTQTRQRCRDLNRLQFPHRTHGGTMYLLEPQRLRFPPSCLEPEVPHRADQR